VLALTRSRGGVLAGFAALAWVICMGGGPGKNLSETPAENLGRDVQATGRFQISSRGGAWRRRWPLALILLVLLAGAALLGENRKRVLGLLEAIPSGNFTVELVGNRPDLWEGAIRLIEKHPFLGWGAGTEVFHRAYLQQADFPPSSNPPWHAHNLLLEWVFETGLVGAGLLGLLGVVLLGRIWRAWSRLQVKNRAFALGASAFFFAMIAHGLVDMPLNRGTWLVYGIGLGILASLGQDAGIAFDKDMPASNPDLALSNPKE